MLRGNRSLQRKIMDAASISGKNIYTRDMAAISNALDMVDDKTSARRKYLENVIHVGPDYRMGA